MKRELKTSDKFKKISRLVKFELLFKKNKYNYNNWVTRKFDDINKDDFKYVIVQLKKEYSLEDYVVYVYVKNNKRFATLQLLETFDDDITSKDYFDKVKNYIVNNTNETIIDDLYNKMFS